MISLHVPTCVTFFFFKKRKFLLSESQKCFLSGGTVSYPELTMSLKRISDLLRAARNLAGNWYGWGWGEGSKDYYFFLEFFAKEVEEIWRFLL